MVCFFSLLPPEKIFLVVTLTLVSNCVTDYVTSATNTKLYTAKNTFSHSEFGGLYKIIMNIGF